MCNAAGLGRHTVRLLNLKNKTSFPPLNYVTTLKETKRDILLRKKNNMESYNAAAAHFSAAVASLTHQASRRRPPGASVFYIDLPVLWDLETDGLAAAIRNDRSPLQRYILKNKQIPGSPAWLCELVPVQ